MLKDNKHLNDKEQLICLYNYNYNKKNNSIRNDIKIVKCHKLYIQIGKRKRKEIKKSAPVKVINSNIK